MNRKRRRILYLWNIIMVVVLSMVSGCSDAVEHVLRTEIQRSIQEAQVLRAEGQYAEALGLLVDALYKEHRLRKLLMSQGEQDLPNTVSDALGELRTFLIHQEPSPLMQMFRNPDIPVEERLAYLAELREFVSTDGHGEDIIVLGGNTYHDPFVHILMSRTLPEGAKLDLLHSLELAITSTYVSENQKHHIKEEITQLQRLAAQQFQEKQYLEAFILLTEAKDKVFTLNGGVDPMTVLQQDQQMIEDFLRTDESPLMQLFRDPRISSEKKLQVLSELRKQLSSKKKEFLFEGKGYTGQLVQILFHSEISDTTRLAIWEKIKRMVKLQGD